MLKTDKIHNHDYNTVWQCPICQKWFSSEDDFFIVGMIAQIQPPQILQIPIGIDKKCFHDLHLSTEPPPKIHLPTPHDIQALQKNLVPGKGLKA